MLIATQYGLNCRPFYSNPNILYYFKNLFFSIPNNRSTCSSARSLTSRRTSSASRRRTTDSSGNFSGREMFVRYTFASSEIAVCKNFKCSEDMLPGWCISNQYTHDFWGSNDVYQELDQETLNRIDHQTRVQALLEEIDFVRRVHDQEIKWVVGHSQLYDDTTLLTESLDFLYFHYTPFL